MECPPCGYPIWRCAAASVCLPQVDTQQPAMMTASSSSGISTTSRVTYQRYIGCGGSSLRFVTLCTHPLGDSVGVSFESGMKPTQVTLSPILAVFLLFFT